MTVTDAPSIEDVEALVRKGQAARDQGERAGALGAFQQAAAIDPTHLGLKADLAGELRLAGRLDDAEILCRDALAAEPNNIGALVELGLIARSRGDRAGSLAVFERAMAAHPSHVALMCYAVSDLRALGRRDQAETLCRDALALNPQDASCLAEMGNLARDRGDLGAALEAFSAASALKPDHVGLRAHVVSLLQELGHLDDAEMRCHEALSIDPTHVACLAELGHIARRRNDPDSAIGAYQHAISIHPTNCGLKVDLAQQFRLLARFEEAEALCREALAIDPTYVDALIQVGHLVRQRGDHAAAFEAFKAVAAAQPSRAALKIEAASDLRQLGRFDEAETFCHQVLALAPDNIDALVGLGLAARGRNDRLAALAAFARAIAAHPNHVGLMAHAVSDLRALGRRDEAEKLCRQALKINPEDVGCLAELGHIAHDRGDFPTALTAFSAASAAKPEHVGLRAQVAQELRVLGRLDEAERCCRDACGIDPTHLATLAELGYLARARGDHDGAIEAFRSATARHPRNAGLKLQMALDLRELGRLDEAELCCRQALEIEPNHAEAFAELGRINRVRGDHGSALIWFKVAVKKSPQQFQHRLDVAAELRLLERLDEAEDILRQALEINPRHSTVLSWIGHIAAKRGDSVKAVEAFEAALDGELTDVGAALDLATALCELGHVGAAEASFLKRLDANPRDVTSLLSLGRIRIEQFRYDEAENLFYRAAEAAPQQFICRLCLGRLAKQQGNHEQALTYFQAARAVQPSHIGAAIETANQHRDLGNFSEAYDILQSVLKTHPNDFDTTMHMAHLHRRRGQRALALETFAVARQLQPGHPQPIIELAIEYRALGNPKESEKMLREAVALAPQNQTTQELLADHYFDAEKFEESLTIARQAIALHPHKLAPYLKASRAALELGHSIEAQNFLEQAERFAGPYPEIKAMRANNHIWLRDWDAAREALLAAGPDRARYSCLWTIAARLSITTGDYAVAEGELPSATALAFDRSRVELLRGQIEEGRWHLQKAASHYRAALALAPEDAGAHFDLARTSLKLLDVEACRHHLRRQAELMSSMLQLRGQSRNVSQTHVGQLLDEYALDQEQLSALKGLCHLPPEQRIAPLKTLVAENPDHTPSAIALLVAMREAGQLVCDFGAPPQHRFAKIPQRIVQYWDESDPPQEISALMNSWQNAHPTFQYVRLDDETAQQFLHQQQMSGVLQAYRRAREPAQRADLLRLAYLSVHGGFYADADDRCLAPLGSYIPSHATFVAFQEDYGTLGNNLIGVVPNHPIIALALELGTEAINRGDNDFLWLATGPGLLTRAFAQIVSQPVSEMLAMGEPTIFDMGYTAKRIGFHCPVSYKKTERHWSRTSFGKRKDAIGRDGQNRSGYLNSSPNHSQVSPLKQQW